MVACTVHLAFLEAIGLLAQKRPLTPLERMDPFTRAKVLAALAALLILGFGMVALVWLGARVTRRYMNQEPLRRRRIDQDDWARKPEAEDPLDRPPPDPESP